jgi:hypothetical protein
MIRPPYHRDQVVLAMFALHGDWSAARAYSDMPRKQVIEDLDDLLAAKIVPVRLMADFQDCLHGERVAEILSRPIIEESAA